MRFVDSSVWLDHLANTNEASSKVITGKELLFCSILTLFEVEKKLRKLHIDGDKIARSLEFLKNRAIVVNLSEEITHLAVDLALQHTLSAVDALIYASARTMQTVLVTADNDFRGLKNVEIIEQLL